MHARRHEKPATRFTALRSFLRYSHFPSAHEPEQQPLSKRQRSPAGRQQNPPWQLAFVLAQHAAPAPQSERTPWQVGGERHVPFEHTPKRHWSWNSQSCPSLK